LHAGLKIGGSEADLSCSSYASALDLVLFIRKGGAGWYQWPQFVIWIQAAIKGPSEHQAASQTLFQQTECSASFSLLTV